MIRDNTPGGMPTISIHGVELSRVEYRGEQVVTFAQVDKVHERPEGTAGRVFRDNRSRFAEGEDFIAVDQPDEIRRLGFVRPQGGTAASVILITKRGYLKLTKPMSDDRAWAVQGEMVDRYFMVEQAIEAVAKPAAAEAVRLLKAREARLSFNGFLKVCRMIGVTGNHAVLSANSATREMVGVDMLGIMGLPRLQSDVGGAQITVTDIGRALGLTARDTNAALLRYGYQTSFRDAKGRIVYEPTEKGISGGGRMAATGKKHSSGTPVTQLVWSTATVEALRSDMNAPEHA